MDIQVLTGIGLKYEYLLSVDSLNYVMSTKNMASKVLERFIGQSCSVLETGVYEAGSACWLLDNILTAPGSSYIGIDDRGYDNLAAARYNLSFHANKARLVYGDSSHILPALSRKFDIVLVDGDHSSAGSFNDMMNGWRLLWAGGLMVVDDYAHIEYEVAAGAERFFGWLDRQNKRHECEVIEKDYKLVLYKTAAGT